MPEPIQFAARQASASEPKTRNPEPSIAQERNTTRTTELNRRNHACSAGAKTRPAAEPEPRTNQPPAPATVPPARYARRAVAALREMTSDKRERGEPAPAVLKNGIEPTAKRTSGANAPS